MTIAAIREKLHHYIDTADDKIIEAWYTILELQIAEMDRRIKECESGEVQYPEKG